MHKITNHACRGGTFRWFSRWLAGLAMLGALLPTEAMTVTAVRRGWVDHTKVTVTFSEAVSPTSATVAGNYFVERASVLSAQMGATSSNVVLTTSAIDLGPSPTLVVNGVQNLALNQTLFNANVTVSLAAFLPVEMGTTASGFQDDFNAPTRDTNWVAIGPDVYAQAGGFLNLCAGSGDPNHLIYVNPAYNGSTQEVLARIKMANVSLQADAFAGIALGVPANSWSLPVRGGLNMSLYNAGAYGGPGQRHFRFLSDYTEFGPSLNTAWTTNVWYWLRLLQSPNASGPDAFAKVWLADGDTPEPTTWQVSWDFSPARSGYAGFRAGILGAGIISDCQVDYVLIKASGLPVITPMPAAFLDDPSVKLLAIALQGSNAVVSWPGAAGAAQLQQSSNLALWAVSPHGVSSNASQFAATVPLTNPATYFRTAPLPATPAPAAGFAFNFGTTSASSITNSWPVGEVVTVLDSNRTQRVRTYTKPGDGFKFQVDSVEFADYPAREWKLWFENPPVAAEFFQNDFGLTNPPTTVTFSEHAYNVPASGNPATRIITEYSDRGLFFDAATPVYWDNALSGNVSGGQVLNYQPFGGGFTQPALPIYFTRPQTNAAFALVVDGGATSALFEALRNGVVVSSATAMVGVANSNNFYGFRNVSSGFDCIRISPNVQPAYLRVDQVQHDIVTNTTISVDLNGKGLLDPTPTTYSGGGPAGGNLWNGTLINYTSPNSPSPSSGFVAGNGAASSLNLLFSGFSSADRSTSGNYGVHNLFEDYVSMSSGTAKLTLRGLTAGATYELFLLASNDGSTAGGVFSVNGSATKTATAGSGTPFAAGRDFVHFTSQANANGQLVVSATGEQSGTSVVNGFQVVGPTIPLPSSEILSNVWAGEIALGRDNSGEFTLHYADGSTAIITDFQPRTATLLPNSTMNFAPVGGRSSDGVMPFFNIAKPGGGGLIVAVGWTGQWKASFVRDSGTNLTVRIGMEDFNLRLDAGERIRTPAVLTLSYEGDWLEGQRQLRRLLLEHYSPRPNGLPIDLPIAASGATLGFNNVTVTNQIQAITNIIQKQLPVDTYWIDAGWEIGGFATGQGNNIPDPARFPNGLAPVSQCAHTNGLRFLLWFEPERVMPNTWLRTNHADWLLTPSGMPPEYAYQQNDGWRMLNLGNPTALNWAKTNFSAIITNWGIDIYRHDFNMHPLWYWRTGEAADRKGMNEIRYVMGLYEYFDTLQQNHPGLLMDNSASGGRRLDFEMYRRLVPLLRTDYLWEVVGAQAMTHALSHWLPMIGQGGVSTANNDFRSGMGSWGTYAFDYYTPGAAFWTPLKNQLANFASLNHLFSGDFYPLTPYSTNNVDWIAWQFHRADLNEGIVQAFRRASNLTPSIGLRLQGLQSGATYQVINFELATTNTATGRQLMNDGVVVRVATPPEATTVKYRRLSP